jgi:hypothetical protein
MRLTGFGLSFPDANFGVIFILHFLILHISTVNTLKGVSYCLQASTTTKDFGPSFNFFCNTKNGPLRGVHLYFQSFYTAVTQALPTSFSDQNPSKAWWNILRTLQGLMIYGLSFLPFPSASLTRGSHFSQTKLLTIC